MNDVPEGRIKVTIPGVIDDESVSIAPRVDVLDSNLRLRMRTWAGVEISVPPGSYVLAVAMPDGSQQSAAAEVRIGETTQVRIDWGPSRFGTVTVRASPFRSVGAKAPSRFYFRGLHLSRNREVTELAERLNVRYVDHIRKSGILEVSVAIGLADSEPDGLSFAQVAAPGFVPVNVALPLVRHTTAYSCRLRVAVSGKHVDADVGLGGSPEAELIGRYLTSMELAPIAEQPGLMRALVYGKGRHPPAAVALGFALLRLGKGSTMEAAPSHLSGWYPWLADAAVIGGEQARRSGDYERAHDLFAAAVAAGLPMFTDAYSLLLSRLEERARQEPAARREVRSNKKARELYDVLTKWAPYVDFDALLFTVRAADLADPGASQRKFEAPADDDSWCTFEDVVGDVENPDSYFSGSC